MSEIKLTQEELKTIEDLRARYSSITAGLGQLKIEQMLVKRQLTRLSELETTMESDYMSTQAEEEKFAQSVVEKYGNGNINLETGIFTADSPSV